MKLLPLIAGVLLLGGCSAAATGAPQPAEAPAVASSAPAPVAVADPVAVTIPAIDAHSTLVPLGLTEGGALDVPPVAQPLQASWYAGADVEQSGDEYQPGEVGPAIIAGHVDGHCPDGSKGCPGIFARLTELIPGDEILVEQDGGGTLRFLVDRVEQHPKAQFPTEAVYGPTSVPELRLITCGGAFGTATAGHYDDNVIVFATLA